MAGKLVISLDFELMWGVRDHKTVNTYGDAVLGGREAIPQILKLFSKYYVGATWATVGLLFARTRREMLDYMPEIRPDYENASLAPYDMVHRDVGDNEAQDPFHFGRSLVDRIADTDGQEIATHTFAHYYCLEPGQHLDAFRADIAAAKAIAGADGHTLRSIVFPRNQYTKEHIEVCANEGILAFRGQPDSFAYRPMPNRDITSLVRGVRLLDSVLPVTFRKDPMDLKNRYGAWDATASHFLRPWRKSWGEYSKWHIRHLIGEMTRAAKEDRYFHIWWHPHNFGRSPTQNLNQLEEVLAAFSRLRDTFGMQSMTMAEAARIASRTKI